jgi:hypothetical protein
MELDSASSPALPYAKNSASAHSPSQRSPASKCPAPFPSSTPPVPFPLAPLPPSAPSPSVSATQPGLPHPNPIVFPYQPYLFTSRPAYRLPASL